MTISQFYRAMSPVVTGTGDSAGVSSPAPTRNQEARAGEFQKELQGLLDKNVQLSKHAENRIRSRSLGWDAQLQDRIIQGLDKAEEKGSREALILAGDVAVIANVKSRTIITAMDRNQMKDKVFTNIDSTVLV